MDSLLADCLPFLSDHLQVRDLFRLEAVSKQLCDTIRHGDNLFHQAIRGEVGYEEDYPLVVPVKKFPDEEESKWERYSAESYPAKLCFHAKLEQEGIAVEDLSAAKIREMGQSMTHVIRDLKKGAPPSKTYNNQEGSPPLPSIVDYYWDQWHCSGYLGLRGGYVHLDFKVICGFVLVFSIREKHEYKHGCYDHQYYHGFFKDNETNYVLERKTISLRSNDDIPFAYVVPFDFCRDTFGDTFGDYECIQWPTHYGSDSEFDNDDVFDVVSGKEEWERLNERHHVVDVWSRGDFSNRKMPELQWLKDGADTIFAITMGRQLLRRIVPNPEENSTTANMRQTLSGEQVEIAKKFVAPHVWSNGRGARVCNANRMLDLYLSLEEYLLIMQSLKKPTTRMFDDNDRFPLEN